MKTGFTKAAGRILVSSASRMGRRVICVTMNDPDDWNDHCALLNRSFSDYQICPVVVKGQRVGTLEVLDGENSRVEVLAAEDFSYALAPEETVRIALPGAGFVYAPAVEGAEAGFAYALISGKAVGKIPIVFGETVEQKPEEEKSFWQKWLSGKNKET